MVRGIGHTIHYALYRGSIPFVIGLAAFYGFRASTPHADAFYRVIIITA